MTIEELEADFDKYDDEYGKFELVENKRSSRPDLHAFILLNELDPKTSDMVTSAEHDQFWLGVDVPSIVEKLTEETIIELQRCGVIYDSEVESFYMFA